MSKPKKTDDVLKALVDEATRILAETREERDRFKQAFYKTADWLTHAEDALIEIKNKHQSYEEQAPTEYGRGVVDGHRCAATSAKRYFDGKEEEEGDETTDQLFG